MIKWLRKNSFEIWMSVGFLLGLLIFIAAFALDMELGKAGIPVAP